MRPTNLSQRNDVMRTRSDSVNVAGDNGTSPWKPLPPLYLWLSTGHAVAEIDNQQSERIVVMQFCGDRA
jgi:hypothetical protein